ncbi:MULTISPECIES: Zn-ribbon domain-containing OB-fold protein [unclassified Pseudomonas]|uniref:Zn-ribbon domain-containing OB-fold protein n=1 Tax=unclassified Pseudomonas TaxID=196821 RepID=UPI000B865F0F|nr:MULTISPECIES: Zn-ribbon domain-containing OB-fold protein [unclassified Pseudomonas]
MTAGPIPEVTPVNQLFWEGTALGELRLRRCNCCGHLFRFVSSWCSACWSADLGWIRASGIGQVSAMTVVHVAPYASVADRVPYVLALVALDEGPVMMSNIVDVATGDVEIGMAVEVTFEARDGLQLPQFRPIRG